jgi:hypothetical protein
MAESTKKTFQLSKEIDGVNKIVRGEEVENGWIITIEKEWKERVKSSSSDALVSDYKHESKKYISKDNPFEKNKEKNEMLDMLNSITKSMGMINVD